MGEIVNGPVERQETEMVIGNTWRGKGESQNHLMVEDGSDL